MGKKEKTDSEKNQHNQKASDKIKRVCAYIFRKLVVVE